jgi:hypothetical protein
MVYGWMHSEGAIHGGNILDSLSKEELKRVHARTFGAGGYAFRKNALVDHYGNESTQNRFFKRDFVPGLACLDYINKRGDIEWKPVDKSYVHGFESYTEAHIIDISREYFRENAMEIIGR